MPKPKTKEIQRRVATIYAVSYLSSRPYRAVELAKVLGLNLRTTYRILSDLRASTYQATICNPSTSVINTGLRSSGLWSLGLIQGMA